MVVRGNPVFDYELRKPLRWWRRLRRGSAKRVLALLFLGLAYDSVVGCYAWATLLNNWYLDNETVVMLVYLLLALVVPAAAATAIAGERQRGSWDLLRLSLLRPRDIVAGKLFGRLSWVGLPLLLASPFIIGQLAYSTSWTPLVVAAGVALPGVVGLAGLGLLCSARAKTNQAAVLAAYGVTTFLVVGIPILDGLQAELGRNWDRDPYAAIVTCPLFAAFALVDLCDVTAGDWLGLSHDVESSAAVAGFCLLYTLLAVLPPWLIVRRWDRWFGEGG